MILGMSTATYTFLHVLVSIVGIVSGLVVVFGLLTAKQLDRWTAIFLATTAVTSISGFGFPFERLLPSHILGIMSLAVLAFAIPALYVFHLAGAWRWIYVIGSSVALYFNVFVLVVQCFEKVPALHALAPTQNEPPFVVAQLAVLAVFGVITVLATVRFHPERVRPA
jgi:hypothetical protein